MGPPPKRAHANRVFACFLESVFQMRIGKDGRIVHPCQLVAALIEDGEVRIQPRSVPGGADVEDNLSPASARNRKWSQSSCSDNPVDQDGQIDVLRLAPVVVGSASRTSGRAPISKTPT